MKFGNNMLKGMILACSLIVLTPIQAHAFGTWTESTCNADKGGTIKTLGGDSFCTSKSSMNWWSAYTWCQAIGGRMPTINELCPTVNSLTTGSGCGRNYSSSGDIWTTTPVSAGSANCWVVGSRGTTLYNGLGRSATSGWAYCVKD